MQNLSPRLSKALEFVEDEKAVVMDIGADHGLFSLACSSLGHKVYASENKKGPYQHLVEDTKGSKVETIFTDGIRILPPDVNTLVILGMGGRTIEGILKENPKKLSQIQTLVIEPQSEFSLPFRFLYEMGFHNDLGVYVFERHYYPLLRFVKGKEEMPKASLLKYGPYPYLHQDPLLITYLETELKRFASFDDKIKAVHQKEIQELEAELNEIKTITDQTR